MPLFLLLILCIALWKSWVKVSFSVWVKYPYIKECLLTPNPEPPWYDIKSCFSACIRCSIWKFLPVPGSSFGSISTSLHTLLSKFTVRSHKSLCHIVTNPSFLQLIACWTSIFALQQQLDGIFGRTWQNHSLRLSQNC